MSSHPKSNKGRHYRRDDDAGQLTGNDHTAIGGGAAGQAVVGRVVGVVPVRNGHAAWAPATRKKAPPPPPGTSSFSSSHPQLNKKKKKRSLSPMTKVIDNSPIVGKRRKRKNNNNNNTININGDDSNQQKKAASSSSTSSTSPPALDKPLSATRTTEKVHKKRGGYSNGQVMPPPPASLPVANSRPHHHHEFGAPAAAGGSASSISGASLFPSRGIGNSVDTMMNSTSEAAAASQASWYGPVTANTNNFASPDSTAAAAAAAVGTPRKRAAIARSKNGGDDTDASNQRHGSKEIVIFFSLVCLVQPQDKDLHISDRLYLLMQQFIPCHRKYNDERGICCKYCQGDSGVVGAWYFAKKAATLAHQKSRGRMFQHIQECKACPEDIRTMLRESPVETLGKSGKIKEFFDRILKRLHQSTTTSVGENGSGMIQPEEHRGDTYNSSGETGEDHHLTTCSATAAAGSSSASHTASLLTPLGSSVNTTAAAAAVAVNDPDYSGLSSTAAARTPSKPAAITTTEVSNQQHGNDYIMISSSLVCLVQPHDRELVSDRFYLLMQQFIPRRRNNNHDDGNNNVCATDNDEWGLCCKYCQGDKDGSGLYFKKTVDVWAHKSTRNKMFQHVQECKACPEDVRNMLHESRDIVGKSGNYAMFFRRILERLHHQATTACESGGGPIQATEQCGDMCIDIYHNNKGNSGTGICHDPTCLKRPHHQSTTAGGTDGPIQVQEPGGDMCIDSYINEERGDETRCGQDRTCRKTLRQSKTTKANGGPTQAKEQRGDVFEENDDDKGKDHEPRTSSTATSAADSSSASLAPRLPTSLADAVDKTDASVAAARQAAANANAYAGLGSTAARTSRKPASTVANINDGGDEMYTSNQQYRMFSLVQPDDRDLVSDRFYRLMQQFIPCYRKNKCGFCCKHCQGDSGVVGALYFMQKAHLLADRRSRDKMFQHVQECQACPEDVRNMLHESRDIVGKAGNFTKFFERILKRLHQSMATEEQHIGGSAMGGCHDPTCLVRPEDLDLVSERVYLMMQQFIPGTKSLSDSTTRGIVCKHCIRDTKRAPGSGFFSKNGDSLQSSHGNILRHVEACQHCPNHIKDKMRELESQDKLFPKGRRKEFYQRIIDRVHGGIWTRDADNALMEYIEQNGDDCEDLCEDLDEYPHLQRFSATDIRMRIESEAFRVKLNKVNESNDQKPQARKALVPVASVARRPPSSDHPIFTQKGIFRVSLVYNAWCHEIDQERAKRVSKATRVKKIVNAVDAVSESIGINITEVLTCFDELQAERKYCFTTVADHIDEFKRIVKTRLRPPTSTYRGPKLLLENDPEEVYIEERAFLFHDPKESRVEAPNEEVVVDLKPLPTPFAHPTEADFPQGSAVVWKYLEEQRVLLADFTQVSEERLTYDDIDFLASMFERDDITCISQGLLDPAKLEERLWDCNAIRSNIGYRTHHKFKRFQQVGGVEYVEMDGLIEMPIEQFFNYLDRREAALDGAADAATNLVISTPGQPVLELDVVKDVLYMIDLDMPKMLPRTFDDFVSNFKMKEILPGGKWCMMNALPASARPFMGPNMYITPGGGFTQLHQDGHGTCDSGHVALSGYNEVVMLRRLPERHKVEACKHLPNVTDAKGNKYDGMYGLPHDQAIGPGWPTQETIAYWKSMNYCPSVFILTAGQHLHINKGRLHAFRKLTPETLSNEDCHYELREALIKEKSLTHKVPNCVSIAWDWQFSGVHAEGMHREFVAILESALLVDKKDGCKCLAIPKAALLALARQVLLPESSSRNAQQQRSSLIDDSIIGRRGFGCDTKPSVIDNASVARGILPALRFLVQNNVKVIQRVAVGEGTASGDKENNMRRGKVSIAQVSDCNINPAEGTVEPDGQDYFCKVCHSELANLYFHCDGCEEHLKKDFNICVDCHQREAWRCTYQMCSSDNQRKSTINHTGDMPFHRKICQCRNGDPCTVCGFCSACSCVCHTCFTLHRRYYDEDMLQEILLRVQEIGSKQPPLPYAEYTEARLLCATDRNGAGLAAKRKLLAEYPRNKEQALQILANGGWDDDDDASDASSRGDFRDREGEEDDRKMAAVDLQENDEAEFLADADNNNGQQQEEDMEEEDKIEVLDSDASSIISFMTTTSTTDHDAALLSIPKEMYAAAVVEESFVMDVEVVAAAPRRHNRPMEYYL